MKQTSFLFIVFWISVQTVYCQSVPWERINPHPIEGTLNEIVNVPGSNKLIAVGSNASIVYSENEGASWITEYKPDNISRMTELNAIQFTDSDLGFVVGEHSVLLKTTNGGSNWKTIVQNSNIDFLDVFFLNEQTGFVVIKDTVMKTTDGGINWVKTALDPVCHYPGDLHFVNDSTGFIGSTHGAYYFKTTNCGESWDSVAINPAIDNFKLKAIHFIDENTGFIGGEVYDISYSTNYILRTTDGGETWNEVYTNSANGIANIYFFNAQRGYTVGHKYYDDIILWTDDGGLNWHESNMCDNYYLHSIAFLPDGAGYCVGDNGQLLKSEDWGGTWNIDYQWSIQASIINTAQAVNETTVYMGTESLGDGGVPAGRIYKSIDGGYSWESVFYLWPIIDLQFLSADFGVAVSSAYGEIYKTIDGAASWDTYEINSFDFSTECVCFIDEQTGFVGGSGDYGLIYKTTDGCETWDIVYPSPNMFYEIYDIVFTDDSTGFAVGYLPDVFLKTTDCGITWSIDTFNVSIMAERIYFINPDTGFALGNKILKTNDGGNTWTEVSTDLEGYARFTDIDFPTEEVGYITVADNETTLLKTDDGGDTWMQIGLMETTSTLKALAFFSKDEGLVMGENSVIFKTYTGGLVGIENQSAKKEANPLVCYPNPVASSLTIDLTTGKVKGKFLEIYSVSGLLMKKVVFLNNEHSLKLNISGFTSGVYIIVLRSEKQIESVAKVVKM